MHRRDLLRLLGLSTLAGSAGRTGTFGAPDALAHEAPTTPTGPTPGVDLILTSAPDEMGIEAVHPMHVHGRQFRVLGRSGGMAANALREGIVDAGWTDTVLVLPEETVRVQLTLTQHPGLYLYHCHILEHEDMGMMRNLRVT